jgi:hypothetical protein
VADIFAARWLTYGIIGRTQAQLKRAYYSTTLRYSFSVRNLLATTMGKKRIHVVHEHLGTRYVVSRRIIMVQGCNQRGAAGKRAVRGVSTLTLNTRPMRRGRLSCSVSLGIHLTRITFEEDGARLQRRVALLTLSEAFTLRSIKSRLKLVV